MKNSIERAQFKERYTIESFFNFQINTLLMRVALCIFSLYSAQQTYVGSTEWNQ